MRDRVLPLLLAGSALCSLPAARAESEAIVLDLPTAMSLAALHNPEVRLARERIAEREGVLIEVRSTRRPRLDTSASYRFVDKGRIETFGNFPQNNESYAADVTASYTVYAGGGRAASEQAARDTLEAARQEVRTVLSGVCLAVGAHYYDALLAREQAFTQEEAIQVFQQQRERAEKRYLAGAGPELDVLRAEVAVANARPPLIRARNAALISLLRLLETTGLESACAAPELFDLEASWPEANPERSLDDYLDHSLDGRSEFHALRLRSQAALAAVRTAGAGWRPTLDVFLNYGATGERFQEDFGSPLRGHSFGAQASWPLWDGGLTRGRVAQAESRVRQLEIERVRLGLEIGRQVQEAWLGCREAAEIRITADSVVRQATEVLRQAEARLEAGAATQLDVLEAQWALTRARLERVQAAYAANLALLRLEHSAGLLGVD